MSEDILVVEVPSVACVWDQVGKPTQELLYTDEGTNYEPGTYITDCGHSINSKSSDIVKHYKFCPWCGKLIRRSEVYLDPMQTTLKLWTGLQS